MDKVQKPSNSDSAKLLEKQSMGKVNSLYIKNVYILKLLLNIGTTEIKELVALGNKFLYACVREVCHL
jgi:hypothetical protein